MNTGPVIDRCAKTRLGEDLRPDARYGRCARRTVKFYRSRATDNAARISESSDCTRRRYFGIAATLRWRRAALRLPLRAAADTTRPRRRLRAPLLARAPTRSPGVSARPSAEPSDSRRSTVSRALFRVVVGPLCRRLVHWPRRLLLRCPRQIGRCHRTVCSSQ